MTDTSLFEPPATHSSEEIEQFKRTWSAPAGVAGLIREINNIPIARRYMVTGFLFFLIGGVQALLLRIQLGTPENTFLDPDTYNQIFTMHGTTMMFLFVIPFIEALANYMVPLLLGTRDLPFPRLTALSYWTYVFGGIFLYTSFLFGAAPDAGWFAYVPLSSKQWSPAINMDWWDIGLSVAEVAAMGAAAELIVAVLRMRAPGMSLDRMPLFAWAMLITAFMIIFAFTPLIVATAMLELDRKEFTSFFVPEAGGDPLLWQHLFWVFGHPEVYIMFVPASGIVSHVVQTFSRRPLVGYPLMVVALVATGFISFGLWVHHMFATGLSPAAMGFFTAASMGIAIPAGIQVFCWVATLWTGRPVWRTPLLFAIGFLFIFVLGGLTGVMVAAVPFDWQVHDTYFVVAHFHYVLIGGVVFPLIAGLYYWLPKVTGKLLDERLGRVNFWVMFIFFNVAFFPMHITGLLGMPRRVYTYPADLGWDGLNLISTIGAFGFALGVLLFVVNFFYSLRSGAPAGKDPWRADTLEWSQDSPPAQAQFQAIPVVRGRHPMWQQETLEPEDPLLTKQLDALDWKPLTWRAALVVSVVEGRPQAVVALPGPNLWPFTMSVAFVFLFAGALLDNLALLGIGALGTMVALTGWFWPKDEQRRALDEMKLEPEDASALPLAVSGRLANGWWGTLVFLAVLATALVTIVASYFYLGHDQPDFPAVVPRAWILPVITTGALVTTAAGMAWQQWILREKQLWLSWIPQLAGVLMSLVALYGIWHTFSNLGIRPKESAYASIVFGLYGFQWLVLLVLLVMQAVAALWALLAPGDPRGHAVALNTTLIGYFSVASWAIIGATLYLGPLLW
jgi:cytochrome c oxidase subunit I+III